MNDSRSKTNSPLLFFVAIFVVILSVMFVVNTKSSLMQELRFALNNGVAYLSTSGHYLAAVCRDNKMYVWDWDDLSKKPVTTDVESDQAVFLDNGLIISIRRSDAGAVVIKHPGNDKTREEIPITAGNRRVSLAANNSGTMIAIMLSDTESNVNQQAYEVLLVDVQAKEVREIAEFTEHASRSFLRQIVVSNDGKFISLDGEKNKHGWIVLLNTEQKRVAWSNEIPDVKRIFAVVFSNDGKVLYARGSDSTLRIINVENGTIRDKWLPLKENRSTLRDQHVQTVAASPDGHLVAAVVFSSFYVWDCTTGKIIFQKLPGHKLVSGLAFSPDSRLLATSDSRQGGTIKIWRIPKH